MAGAAECSEKGCCAPARTGRAARVEALSLPSAARGNHAIEQVVLRGGPFFMGDSFGDGRPGDGEGPVHEVWIGEFAIDATCVTNEDFARFVAATGYRTEAERFGYSAVFHLALEADGADVLGSPPEAPWWLGVAGADWRHPGGRASSIEDRADHPVVHVSWNDALAYCAWSSRRLPTEAEWEFAARGGAVGERYPWGDELHVGQARGWPCNIWQGRFPDQNDLSDGWLTTAPVRAYAPNSFDLWQMVGNVWEWCADWFDPTYYASSPPRDPRGPEFGSRRVLRGGSYLCHDSYCNRYRNAARSSNTPDSSTANCGFRTVSLRSAEIS